MGRSRPRLLDFNKERSSIIKDAAERVTTRKLAQAASDPREGLEYVLNEAAFHEVERLTRFGADEDIGEVGGLGFWRGLARRVRSAGEGEKRRVLERLVSAYMNDIAGNFDERVYTFANQVIPVGLSMLFNTQGGQSKRWRRLDERVQIQGDVETLQALAQRGTLIVAPTHLSNLDSIVIGWGLKHAGLPPVTYGAGKNLFTNPLLSYFMRNLGAYRVDRRIQHQLYKDCLKTYSEVLLARGFHSLFFPGGTRSRSGEVEQRLKLGLLGTGLSAYIDNLQRDGADGRPIFIAPLTLNFGLVLEAEGLVNDYLRAVGREYYLLSDDPFNSPLEVARFATKIATMETSMVLRFGAPMDLLGNRVDASGQAYDRQGHRVDTASYFEVGPGVYGPSPARDREYTRQAGEALCDAFVRNTVIMPTQFLAYLLFEAARRHFPNMPLVRVLRFGEDLHVPWDEVNAEAARLQAHLKQVEADGGIALLDPVREMSVPELVDRALDELQRYHPKTPAEATGQGIRLGNMNLLYYYSNRLRVLEGLDDV